MVKSNVCLHFFPEAEGRFLAVWGLRLCNLGPCLRNRIQTEYYQMNYEALGEACTNTMKGEIR